jgi:lipid-A-disaccharide synthase-like uncharacterized protein
MRLLSPASRAMNEVLFALHHVTITPWKLIGYLGTFLFTARWFVQLYATKKMKRVHMPLAFWWLSIVGSVMTLGYFIWGKNDSVGIIQTAFPMLVSIYNVVAHLREHKPEVISPRGPEET